MFQCCHIVLCQEMLCQNRPVCWSIVMKEKSSVGSPYFEAFPSDRVARATKVVFFFHSSNSCKLYKQIPANYNSEFRELLKATT